MTLSKLNAPLLSQVNIKESVNVLAPGPTCKVSHITLMVVCIYSMLGKHVKQTNQGYSRAVMAVMTQDMAVVISS
jgi:hypothetical protein